jgi:hypothetical protein
VGGRVLALSVVLWAGVVAVIVVVAGLTGAGGGDRRASAADGCGGRDTRVVTAYPVSGYWLFPDADPCGPRKALQRMHRIGADTVITSGPELQSRQVDLQGRLLGKDGKPDPAFAPCARNGRTCYQSALDVLRAGHPDNSIVGIYALSLDDAGGDLVRCPGQDVRIVVNGQVFHRLLIPEQDAQTNPCDTRLGRAYALVLVAGTTPGWTSKVLDEADAFGMKVYLGLLTQTRQPRRTWNMDPAHRDVALAVSRRLLEDEAKRFARHRSFAGVYQPFEVRIRRWDRPSQDVNLQGYAAQHAAVREVLPGRKILASPYWDTRRAIGDPTDPAAVESGIRDIARTGVDIIAPQDGRGTGKGALYWPHQADQPVDERLRAVGGVGDRTYGQAYIAPAADYYAAAARARTALARENRHIDLWANVEAFEPTPTASCDPGTGRGRTDKARLDQAVTAAAGSVGKLVAFKWNGLMTCLEGRPTGLADDIAADGDRPIVVGASPVASSDGRKGIAVRGFRLDGSSMTLTWYDERWRQQSRIVRAVPYPATAAPAPAGLQTVWVPFGMTGLARDFWIHIDAVNASGKVAANRYSMRY